MSRSEIDPRRPEVAEIGSESRPLARPIAPIERAFRLIVEYRSQPNFVHVPERVAA
jgi:hypothetical protein